jgi:hypothetical protein
MRHLSDEEIAGWALSERTRAMREHVAECEVCREHTGQLQAALTGFRESALRWSVQEWSVQERSVQEQPGVFIRTPRPWWLPRPQWLLAAAAIAALAALPAYERYSAHQTAARERLALDAAADTALLRQVDTGISRAVPAPMEPLLTLVSGTPVPPANNSGIRISGHDFRTQDKK